MSGVREETHGVAFWVERQSGGALLLSDLLVLWEYHAEFDVRTATTLLQP
jgi:hypothetical protein